MTFHSQHMFDVRCEWGAEGLHNLAEANVIVIVDVLSFSTSVDVAVSQGASVLPLPTEHSSPAAYTEEQSAQLASKRNTGESGLSLSPCSLVNIHPDTRLVLPSPNGSRLSFEARAVGSHVIAGSLRNARAVAEWVRSNGNSVAVIPAGERWENGFMRPALEDLIGAGAIISSLRGSLSPEASAAAAVFQSAREHLEDTLRSCTSGRELIARGFTGDVELASELDVSSAVPLLNGVAFENQTVAGSA